MYGYLLLHMIRFCTQCADSEIKKISQLLVVFRKLPGNTILSTLSSSWLANTPMYSVAYYEHIMKTEPIPCHSLNISEAQTRKATNNLNQKCFPRLLPCFFFTALCVMTFPDLLLFMY